MGATSISTSQSACTKWCPMVRQVWADFDDDDRYTTIGKTAAFNRVRENRGSRERRTLCIAEACMMWRILGSLDVAGSNGVTQQLEVGYCGLAGPPLAPEHQTALLVAMRMQIISQIRDAA